MTVSAASRAGQFDRNYARDSLHILPLEILPIETPGIRRSHLIKNSRLQSVVEIFRDDVTGSGQVEIHDLDKIFPANIDSVKKDLPILAKIASIKSFDVYSLRIELRNLSISVNDISQLSLSPVKRAELTERMKVFTRPLIQFIYGNEQQQIEDVSDIFRMFSHPNKEEALNNLRRMSERLQISLQDIPNFLEEYGDIFLSLAYFRKCLDEVVPDIHSFLDWSRQILKSQQFAADKGLVRQLGEIERDLGNISASLTGRFESFDLRSRDFWKDINAESFRRLRELIQSHHTTIGGVLCGLVLKMDMWKRHFPLQNGGPNKRVEFIRSEVLPGLSTIRQLEQDAARG